MTTTMTTIMITTRGTGPIKDTITIKGVATAVGIAGANRCGAARCTSTKAAARFDADRIARARDSARVVVARQRERRGRVTSGTCRSGRSTPS